MKLQFLLAGAVGLCAMSGCNHAILTSKTPPDGVKSTGKHLIAQYYLPAGAVRITGQYSTDIQDWALEMAPEITADVSPDSRPLRLYYSNALFFDDTVNVSVDATTGLLSSVAITNDDKTGKILSDVVATAASALMFASGLAPISGAMHPQSALEDDANADSECNKFKSSAKKARPSAVDIIVKHGEPATITLANNLPAAELAEELPEAPIVASIAELTFTLCPGGTLPNSKASAAGGTNSDKGKSDEPCTAMSDQNTWPDPQGTPSGDIDGIAVKWPAPYILTVERTLSVRVIRSESIPNGDKADATEGHAQATTPDPPSAEPQKKKSDRCYYYPASGKSEYTMMLPSIGYTILPLHRRPFVSDKSTLTISKGMLTAVNIERPSAVAGAVGIPKAVLESLAPIPLKLRQETTNNINAIIDLKAAEKKLKTGE